MAARAEHPAHREQADGQGARGPPLAAPPLAAMALDAWPPGCYPAGRQQPVGQHGGRRPRHPAGGDSSPRPGADKGGLQPPGRFHFYSPQRLAARGQRAQEWGQPGRLPAEHVQAADGLPPDKRATVAWQLHATLGQGAICPERMRVGWPSEPLCHWLADVAAGLLYKGG